MQLIKKWFNRLLNPFYSLSKVEVVEKKSINKWDIRFLNLAKFISDWSLDPSTRTGAVIVDKDNRIVSVGYNGFAKGVQDHKDRYKDRDLKYKLIVHSDVNSILFANRDLTDCTIYTWPFSPCVRCSSIIIQSNIKRVVSPPLPANLVERWGEDLKLSEMQFREAGVQLDIIDMV